MDIDAGIVVIKQITDEQKWFQAMEEIEEEFMEEEYFEILPEFDKEEINELIFNKLNLDEDMNFSPNGYKWMEDWREFPYKKDLPKLKHELIALQKKMEDIHKGKQYHFDKYANYERYEQTQLERLSKAIEFKQNCDEESNEILQEIRKLRLRSHNLKKKNAPPMNPLPEDPPTLFRFSIGQPNRIPCVRLPVFGRHFKNCSTNISDWRTESILKKIYRILKDRFPSNIAYWSDKNETQVLQLVDSGLYKLDQYAVIPKEIFYEQVKKSKVNSRFNPLDLTDGFKKDVFFNWREIFLNSLLRHEKIKTGPTTSSSKFQFHRFRPTKFTTTTFPTRNPSLTNPTSSNRPTWPTKTTSSTRPKTSTRPISPKMTIPPSPMFRDSGSNYAKISSAEKNAEVWVVEENKEKPWNMEKVLEELGEVLTF